MKKNCYFKVKPPKILNIDNPTNIAPIRNIKNPLNTTKGVKIWNVSGNIFSESRFIIEYNTDKTKKNKLKPNNIMTQLFFIIYQSFLAL
jgi:hypothetical protein